MLFIGGVCHIKASVLPYCMLWFLAVARRQTTCDGTAMTSMHRILNINTPLGEDNAVLMAMSCQEALGRLPEYKLWPPGAAT